MEDDGSDPAVAMWPELLTFNGVWLLVQTDDMLVVESSAPTTLALFRRRGKSRENVVLFDLNICNRAARVRRRQTLCFLIFLLL
jgi:hypothetical protein